MCVGYSEFFGEWGIEGVWKLFWGGEKCYEEEWRDYKYENMKEERYFSSSFWFVSVCNICIIFVFVLVKDDL